MITKLRQRLEAFTAALPDSPPGSWAQCDQAYEQCQTEYRRLLAKVAGDLETGRLVRQISCPPGITHCNERYIEDIGTRFHDRMHYWQTEATGLIAQFHEARRANRLKKVNDAFDCQRISEALDRAERILQQDPAHADLHQRLERINSTGGGNDRDATDLLPFKRRIDRLRRRYRLKHEATIHLKRHFEPERHSGLSSIAYEPHGLLIAAGQNYLLRSSTDGKSVARIDFGLSAGCQIWQARFCPRSHRYNLLIAEDMESADITRLSMVIAAPSDSKRSRRHRTLPLENPRGLSISTDGRIAVCELEGCRVHLFSHRYERLLTIGQGGDIRLGLDLPATTAFCGDSSLLIGDQRKACIYKIDLSRRRILWTTVIPNILNLKPFCGNDARGNVYATGFYENQLLKISSSGELIYRAQLPTIAANGVYANESRIFVYDNQSYDIHVYETIPIH